MAGELEIWDSVVETSTTTGTGAFTLAGALTGYQRFDDVCAVTDKAYYLIEAIDGNGDRTGEWETGLGTYSATDTLTRTITHDSSNAGAAVNFAAGTKRVSLTLTGNQMKFRGVLAYKGSDQTTANYTTATALTFDTNDYETTVDVVHDTVSNTSRITIPPDATRVKFAAQARVESLTASNFVALYLYKNGSVSYVGQTGSVNFSNQTVMEVSISTPMLRVVPGDYFEVFLEIGTDTSVTVKGTRTWFAMEIVE